MIGSISNLAKWTEFKRLVEGHDLTYSYSDDNRYYEVGQAQRDAILKLAESFPPIEVEQVWNACVDLKIAEPYRAQFYWHPSWHPATRKPILSPNSGKEV
jgi:hypothetical protein